jgi:hypothetical protein
MADDNSTVVRLREQSATSDRDPILGTDAVVWLVLLLALNLLGANAFRL